MYLYFLISFFFINTLCYNIDVENAIVYSVPRTSDRLQYFGLSVAIRPLAKQWLTEDKSSWVIQIGAPRANVSTLPAITEPGSVYRCSVNGNCHLKVLDSSQNKYEQQKYKKNGVYRKVAIERKDGGWVGISMDIKKTRYEQEINVVCGHRITYQAVNRPKKVEEDHYLTIGGCYMEHSNGTISSLFLPLNNEDRAYASSQSGKIAYFDWGQGVAGVSAHISPSGTLLLGAPNVYFMGTFVLCSLDDMTTTVDDSSYYIKTLKQYYSYNGYAVGSGKFFTDKKEWFIFGGPRSADLHGRIFRASFKDNLLTVDSSMRIGETYGEYFGASLDVGDINNDGFDDLIVGAPSYSASYFDQGRVYVYLGGGKDFKQDPVINGGLENARFGTCVRVVGDLDRDGYRDVVIGAPNEANGGAIFLYRGSKSGLSRSQVIQASHIHSQLRGFGSSISLAVDLDTNDFKDIVVGAYQSDQAVLLRTRPVVTLKPKIYKDKFLDRSQPNCNITVCVPYETKGHPPTCTVDVTLAIDDDRAHFASGRQEWKLGNVTTAFNDPFCQNLTIQLDARKLDETFDEPIKLSLRAQLVETAVNKRTQVVWDDHGVIHSLLPIESASAKKVTEEEITFAGDCGTDKICQSNLALQCQFSNVPKDSSGSPYRLVVGWRGDPELEVSVRNFGTNYPRETEPAHYTTLHLSVSGAYTSDVIPSFGSECWQGNGNYITCDLKTISRAVEKNMSFLLPRDVWKFAEQQKLIISLYVNTSSVITREEDSKCQLTLEFYSDASDELVGASSPPIISLNKIIPSQINFTQQYEVLMNGISAPTVTSAISISFPIRLGQVILASLGSDFEQVNVTDDDFKPRTFQDEHALAEMTSRYAERTLFLNCSSTNVECVTISHQSSVVNVSIIFNISAIVHLLNDFDLIHYSSNCTADTQFVFEAGNVSYKTVSTFIVMAPTDAAVDISVIILSVLAGIFLLALVVTVLVRKGFFRRKTKEQMEAMKNDDFLKERFSMYKPYGQPDPDEATNSTFNEEVSDE